MPPEDEEEQLENEEETEEETSEETEEETTEEETEESSTEEMSAEEVKEAQSLYKLLKDGKTRTSTLTILAERAGILNKNAPPETKVEQKTAKKAIKTVLAEKLGEKYSFFVDVLAPALEEILGAEREETTRQLSSVEVKQTDTEVERALERLSGKTKGESRKVEAKMVSLMDSLPKSDKISTFDYLEHLYTIASADKKTLTTTRQIANKINKTANDATTRLKTSPSTGTGTTAPSKKLTLTQSIDKAMKQLKIR